MKKIQAFFGVITITFIIASFPASGFAQAERITWKGDGAEMVLVPAGEFTMGSDKMPAESPAHKVMLESYYIDRFEVTNEKYMAFCKAAGHKPPVYMRSGAIQAETANYPVNKVTWDDAKAYCEWAGKRLPSETEWEKAARGADGRVYPWGSGWNPAASNNRTSSYESVRPVDAYPQGKSPCGAEQMAGNVWEWTADWYKSYPGSPVSFDETGQHRVARGGAFFYSIELLRSANRYPLDPMDSSEHGGFRCAADAPKSSQ